MAGYRSLPRPVYQSTTTQPRSDVSGLTCGTAYTFAVDAFDAAGNASPRVGDRLDARLRRHAGAHAPAGVVATSRTATSIALTWSASTDNVGVTGYGLYRGGALVGTGTGTTGIFTGLTCNTNYTLAVDAVDAAGNRSARRRSWSSTTACPDTPAPSAPTGLAASNVTQTSLTLSWNASTDNVGVMGYDVYRNGTKVATVATTASTPDGARLRHVVHVRRRGLDAAGNRSPQAQMNASTSACSTAAPTLQGVDGGASYYGSFASPLPTDPAWFPIGTWGSYNTTQANRDSDAASGSTPMSGSPIRAGWALR